MRIRLAHGPVGAGDGSGRFVAETARLLVADGHDVVLAVPRWDRPEPPPAPVDGDATGACDVLLGGAGALRALLPSARRFVYAPLDAGAERWALEACDVLFRFTDDAVRWLEDDHGLALRAKAVVAPLPAAPGASPSLDRPGPPLLLSLGRLVASKDVAFLLRAAARLRTKEWRFALCGAGPEEAALRALAAELGIAARVSFEGFVAEPAAWYRRAALFLTASVSDHFPFAVVDALAAGTPCLVRRPDGARVRNAGAVQVVEGETGHRFGDEDELAARIDGLLADEARRRRFAAAGWALQRDRFGRARFRRALRYALCGPDGR